MAYPPPAFGPLLALVLLASPGACQREPLPGHRPDPTFGAAAIEFQVPGTVETIGVGLTGPNGFSQTEEVVASGGAATSTIAGLPVGEGYLVTASARAADGATCAGSSALFAIVANQTTTVSVSLTCSPAGTQIDQIGHIVVIYMENHSFDSLYGGFPGVEGLSSPTANVAQIDDATGLPYPTLPQGDERTPADLPNRPFDVSAYIPADMRMPDPIHRFYQQQWQINGGKMDRFATISNAKGLVMGYYPTATLPVAKLALDNPTETTICDHFFHAAFGGSFLNHVWLISATTPVFPNPPPDAVIKFDDAGNLVADGSVTDDPEHFVVVVLDPAANPHAAGASPEWLVPPQVAPTIGDRLSAAGVDWAWYAGGWNAAATDNSEPNFIPGHQPFLYFEAYAEGTAARAAHLKDESLLAGEIAAGTLPPVAFVKPMQTLDEHPGGSDLLAGENHAAALIKSLMASPFWDDTVVILTYDENGGLWDHVAPPVVDRWGPGTRVPALIFSPFAKGGVDSTVYDTTAILKLIETRWNLPALGTRDAAQPDLSVHALKLPQR
jgi:phospholipase C